MARMLEGEVQSACKFGHLAGGVVPGLAQSLIDGGHNQILQHFHILRVH